MPECSSSGQVRVSRPEAIITSTICERRHPPLLRCAPSAIMGRMCWSLSGWSVSIRMAARLSHGRSSRHSQCLNCNNRTVAAAASENTDRMLISQDPCRVSPLCGSFADVQFCPVVMKSSKISNMRCKEMCPGRIVPLSYNCPSRRAQRGSGRFRLFVQAAVALTNLAMNDHWNSAGSHFIISILSGC